MHNKEKVNINLALSKSLLERIKREAAEQELSYSALIRLILQAYLDNKYDTREKTNSENLDDL